MTYYISLFVFALAIERITEVMTRVALFEKLRSLWERTFPKVGKLASCKFCQSFWLSGLSTWFLPGILSFALGIWAGWIATWMVVWGFSLIWGSVMEKLVDGTPFNLFVTFREYETTADEDSDS